MFGKSILINDRDKITLKPPSFIVQKIISCCVINIIFIFGYIFLANFADDNGAVFRLTKITTIFMIFLLIFCFFYVFSLNSKFIFDKKLRKVYRVDLFFFIPSTTTDICNFRDISYLTINCIKDIDNSIDIFKDLLNIKQIEKGYKTKLTYYLVFVTKKQPYDFIQLTNTLGYYLALDLNDLIIMGEELSQAIECEFKKDIYINRR
ncbi:MAG: hypothetical protein IKO19_07450 [Candidatus Riflebacteria bacterium]|nr:hypothetical protein [Candidatus Riflebacteria bacterium]